MYMTYLEAYIRFGVGKGNHMEMLEVIASLKPSYKEIYYSINSTDGGYTMNKNILLALLLVLTLVSLSHAIALIDITYRLDIIEVSNAHK